jgi:hypothetical protein
MEENELKQEPISVQEAEAELRRQQVEEVNSQPSPEPSPEPEQETKLTPITSKEQGLQQTTGTDQFSEFHAWRKLEPGPERQARKNEWTMKHYNMSAEEYDSANEFQKFGAGWKNQQPTPGSAAAAVGMGAIDFPIDVLGNIPGLGGVDDWWDEKTELNNPTLNSWRDFGNLVIPSMLGSGAVLNSTKGMNAIRQGSALLGVDLAVTGLSDTTNNPNLSETLSKSFPNVFGPKGSMPLPQFIQTNDDMSGPVRKAIHMLEAGPFALLGNTLGFLVSRGKPRMGWFKPKDTQAEQFKAIELARTADNDIQRQLAEIDSILATKPNPKDARLLKERKDLLNKQLTDNNSFEDYVTRVEKSKESQIDAAGKAKLQDSELGFDEDITRIPGEINTGYNSVGEGTIARNMAETTAIKTGNGTSDDLPVPILTENTRRKALRVSGVDSPVRTTILDIENQARKMGEFEVISGNIKYSRKVMDKAAEEIFTSIMNASDVDATKQIFMNERSLIKFVDGIEVSTTNEAQTRALYWAIVELFDKYIGGPILRTSARFMDTTGREIAASAEALTTYGSELVNDIKESDKLLGKLQYLLTEYGTNAEVSSAMLKLKDASGTGPKAVDPEELIPHMLKEFKRVENSAHGKAKRFVTQLKELQVKNPLAIKPLVHAFRETKGDVDTLDKLYKFTNNSVTWRGLFKSPTPGKMNQLAKGLWGVIYNNYLSGLAPLNALKGAISMNIVAPINQLTGSALIGVFDSKGRDDFTKILYYHGAFKETQRRALTQGWETIKKVHQNADALADVARSDFLIKEGEELKIVDEMAEVWRKNKDIGNLFQYKATKMLRDFYRWPWHRTGMTLMAGVDTATNINAATWISRMEAWEEVAASKGGLLSAEALEIAEKANYSRKFNKNNVLIDPVTKAHAGEIKFNNNDSVSKAINNVTNNFPPAKIVFTFPRATSNGAYVKLSYGPLASIPGLTKYGDTIWAKTDEDIAKALAHHGIDYDTYPHARQFWRVKRAEYMGRLAWAAGVSKLLFDYALDGNIQGPGHYNPTRRMRDMKWYGRRPQTIRNPLNGDWISYRGIPGLEQILDTIGMLSLYATDINEGFLENSFDKFTWYLMCMVGDETYTKSLDSVFGIMKGDDQALKNLIEGSIVKGLTPWGSGLSLHAKALDQAQKDIYDDFTASLLKNFPIVSQMVPDEVDALTGENFRPFGNYLANAILTYSPIKIYAGDEKGPLNPGKTPWRKTLRDIGWTGMNRLLKDSSGLVELDNETRNKITERMSNLKTRGFKDKPLWKAIEDILNERQHKEVIGRIRAVHGGNFVDHWEDIEFDPQRYILYDRLNKVLRVYHEIAEYELSQEGEIDLGSRMTQALVNKLIKEGRIEEAVTTGNKYERDKRDTETLLQMSK